MNEIKYSYDGSLAQIRERGLLQNLKRFQIIKIVRENKLISRRELSKRTHLDAPTVSRVTKELIRENILEEVGKDSSTSLGRNPIWLTLKKSSRFLIGLDIGAYETKAVITNLESEVICQHSDLTYRGRDEKAMLAFIVEIINSLLSSGSIAQNDVEGIGIAVSGVIDNEKGKVVVSCNLPTIQGIKLTDYIQDYFAIPTEICNGGGVWALRECERCRNQRKDPDFLVLHAGYGIALSHLIDGRAVIGRSAKAKIDFGHVTYNPKGPACKCGSIGCLESFTGGWAIARDAQQSPSDLLLSLVDGKTEAIEAKDVFEAALRGDNNSLMIIVRAGEILGETAARFIEFFNPRQVILSGSLVTNSLLYHDAIMSAISRCMPEDRFSSVDICVTSLDKFAGAVGVTQLLSHDILYAPIKDMVRVGW